MFNKKQYRILLLSAMGVFFIIALLIYMFYMGFEQKEIIEEPLAMEETMEIPDQTVMTQNVVKIGAGTNVIFEIVDQFGFITQKDQYKGINWLDYTKPQLGNIFPEYVITKYEEDEVVLTRVIERQVEPNYILTTDNGNIVISIERNGHKIFYKETGLEQHDLSNTLEQILEKGIPITPEQKDAILHNSDEIYMILQEYDE